LIETLFGITGVRTTDYSYSYRVTVCQSHNSVATDCDRFNRCYRPRSKRFTIRQLYRRWWKKTTIRSTGCL